MTDRRQLEDRRGLDQLERAIDSVATELATTQRRRPSLLRSPLAWIALLAIGGLSWVMLTGNPTHVVVVSLKLSGREVQARVITLDDTTLVVPQGNPAPSTSLPRGIHHESSSARVRIARDALSTELIAVGR